MKQRKKQIGARYVAKVRGAFHRVVKIPRSQGNLRCAQSAAAMK
jgi:hypothetical protein